VYHQYRSTIDHREGDEPMDEMELEVLPSNQTFGHMVRHTEPVTIGDQSYMQTETPSIFNVPLGRNAVSSSHHVRRMRQARGTAGATQESFHHVTKYNSPDDTPLYNVVTTDQSMQAMLEEL
jgi:hypothetical protein